MKRLHAILTVSALSITACDKATEASEGAGDEPQAAFALIDGKMGQVVRCATQDLPDSEKERAEREVNEHAKDKDALQLAGAAVAVYFHVVNKGPSVAEGNITDQ